MTNFDAATAAYMNHLANTYEDWSKPRTGEPGVYAIGDLDIRQKMAADFRDSLTFEDGNKYRKIINGANRGRSVHSFIVLEDGPKWKRGDILKAASWAAPAQNFKRGSIFNPDSYKNHYWSGL